MDLLGSGLIGNGFNFESNSRGQVRFPSSSNGIEDSFISPMQRFAPINNLLSNDAYSHDLVQGKLESTIIISINIFSVDFIICA